MFINVFKNYTSTCSTHSWMHLYNYTWRYISTYLCRTKLWRVINHLLHIVFINADCAGVKCSLLALWTPGLFSLLNTRLIWFSNTSLVVFCKAGYRTRQVRSKSISPHSIIFLVSSAAFSWRGTAVNFHARAVRHLLNVLDRRTADVWAEI